MTFYLNGSPSWGNNYEVSLGTTAASEFASSALNSDPVTQVCTGTLSVQNGELTFNFTTPYVYNGGNLLFDITTLSASYSSGEFFGVSTSDYSSIYVYGSNPPYRLNFIPKTQFSFTGGATCLTPNNLGISNITVSSATFSWHNQSIGTNLVAVDTIGADEATLTWIPVNETTHTFTNLSPGTHYQAFVRSDCGGGDLSATNFISFYTECDATTTSPWTENFEGEWITSNAFNQEGKVIVQIRVNAAGNVTEATIKGGNVSDKQTQQLALDAARKAKFTEGDHDQIGTITYIFKLN
jgi:TonB family protein